MRMSDLTTCLCANIPFTVLMRLLKSLLTIAPNSQSLNRMLFKFQHISFMLASRLNVTQPRRNHLLSAWGSARATLKKPSYLSKNTNTYIDVNILPYFPYLEHIASISCLVIVGARFLKNIDVVLCRKDLGFSSGLASTSTVSIISFSTSSFFSTSSTLAGTFFFSLFATLSTFSSSLSLLLLLDELLLLLLPE